MRAANWVFAPANLGALEAALAAATNGNLLYVTNGIPTVGTATPGSGQYPLASDLALFNFQTLPGSGLQVAVPAPAAAMFGPTTTVIDPTAPLSAAVIAAVIGCLGDSAGNAATAFINGTKASRRTEQVGG